MRVWQCACVAVCVIVRMHKRFGTNGLPTLEAGEQEELPLMGCPDGVDSVCDNVTIPAVIIYSHDRQLLQGETLERALPACWTY